MNSKIALDFRLVRMVLGITRYVYKYLYGTSFVLLFSGGGGTICWPSTRYIVFKQTPAFRLTATRCVHH